MLRLQSLLHECPEDKQEARAWLLGSKVTKSYAPLALEWWFSGGGGGGGGDLWKS